MAGFSLTSINNTLTEDPAPAFRFECELPAIISSTGSRITAPTGVLVQKVSVGQRIINSEDLPWAGWQKSFATGSSTEDISMTILEKADYSISDYFREWFELIHDQDGNFGLPGGDDGYWKDMFVYPLDVQGKRRAKFHVKECYPAMPSPYDYDGETTMAIYVNVAFKANRVVFSRL